jgi:hypothetical protein
MLDSTAPTAFAPAPEIAWRGVLNESSPPPGRRWIPGAVQAQQFSSSTTTAVLDSVSSWAGDRTGQTERPLSPNARDIDLRIQALRVEAEIDQIPFSIASYADFRDFIGQVAARVRPSIFLRDNGNLRALWKNDNQEQIGLQFLGGGDVQYVILKRRPGGRLMPHYGVDSRGRVLAAIRAAEATALFG